MVDLRFIVDLQCSRRMEPSGTIQFYAQPSGHLLGRAAVGKAVTIPGNEDEEIYQTTGSRVPVVPGDAGLQTRDSGRWAHDEVGTERNETKRTGAQAVKVYTTAQTCTAAQRQVLLSGDEACTTR